MNGRQFARFVLGLPPEEQALDVATLVDLYDGPTCTDCGKPHRCVFEAFACDDFTDARHRATARRTARRLADDLT